MPSNKHKIKHIAQLTVQQNKILLSLNMFKLLLYIPSFFSLLSFFHLFYFFSSIPLHLELCSALSSSHPFAINDPPLLLHSKQLSIFVRNDSKQFEISKIYRAPVAIINLRSSKSTAFIFIYFLFYLFFFFK